MHFEADLCCWPSHCRSPLSQGSAAEFWGYNVASEPGPRPLYLSIIPEDQHLQFYWTDLGTNYVYTLEGSDSLTSTNWSPVPGASWPLQTNHWILAGTDTEFQCYRVRAEPQEVAQSPQEELSFRTLAGGGFSGILQGGTHVIKTRAGWEAFWEQHRSHGTPPRPLPEVDFEQEMVVVVLMGQQPSSGYAVEIKRIEATPSRLKVLVEHTVPGLDAYVLDVITTPFHFVAVRKNDLQPGSGVNANTEF